MKTLHKILQLLLLSSISISAFSQNNDESKALVKQGVTLHDEGKYADAIDKYKQAIKIDSSNYEAYYEISYSMFASGKGKEALSYLQKAVSSDSPFVAGSYDLLGSIYDDNNEPEKAIECFKKGIAANPKYQRLYYNLSVTYLRQAKYAEAEAAATEAIKLDPKHASSQRSYALAANGLGKRGVSLLAWCSFLILEPQSKRSEQAYTQINRILNYGIKQTGEKKITISVSPDDNNTGNLMLPMSILAATLDKKGLTRTDSLTLQLKRAFEISENFAQDKNDLFFIHFFSDYFKKLAATDNMQAFAYLVSLAGYKEENTKWFKENEAKLKALSDWIMVTKREL